MSSSPSPIPHPFILLFPTGVLRENHLHIFSVGVFNLFTTRFPRDINNFSNSGTFQMNFDSLSAMSIEDRVRKMARVLEKLSADKNILDLTKIFGKKKWEKLKKRQTENPEPVANRREVDKQPCGLCRFRFGSQ